MRAKRKLIEVVLPLGAINKESLRRKTKAPKGWPTTFHKWWAQRPLAAARAVIFAQMVDDPTANPDLFATEKLQKKERERLFRILEELVKWDNSKNEEALRHARAEIWQSWRRACAENAELPKAAELFDARILPAFWDPFAGSGSLPLSAQWLGLQTFATDLNPVAVLICKALIEIPSRFSGRPAVNPSSQANSSLLARETTQARGIADDVRYYGDWVRARAERKLAELYPALEITRDVAQDRSDLKSLVGRSLPVVAWFWARTVKSPNPAFAHVDVPLATTFVLSNKKGNENYVQPIVRDGTYRFVVKHGTPRDLEAIKNGTKLGRANFKCLMSGAPISAEYIKSEGRAGRIGAKLMGLVADGPSGRLFFSPTSEQESAANAAHPNWQPDTEFFQQALGFRVGNYGMTTWSDLFTRRQLVCLATFSDLIATAIEEVRKDAVAAGHLDDGKPLHEGGSGARAYAEAIGVYLACVVDRMAYYGSTLVGWLPKDNALGPSMPRQTVSMTWDFAEANPFGKSSGDITSCTNAVANYLDFASPNAPAHAEQGDARAGIPSVRAAIVSTDPPYYDNVGYADLSDFFYVWLRRSMRTIFPALFSTVTTPKAEELVATPERHGGKERAEMFFLDGMTQAMRRVAQLSHPAFPITIYYAFKQAEEDGDEGVASTGWDTFLSALISSGFTISGTWPLRTEGETRMRGMNSNALASSIVLVCRPRDASARPATRREFLAALRAELPQALSYLQAGNIAPVDLAQAAIGPGMAVYTRYSAVLDAEGAPVRVREALTLINQVLDETLAEQEGDFDADSRFALAWFEQHGFADGEFGVADVLARAKNTSVDGLRDGGILESRRGKVRLKKPGELPKNWDPATDARLTNWETVHHLIRVLEAGGESAAAELVAKLGSKSETARELAYRLYTVCERKKRASEALSYNALVQSWPEIARLAREGGKPRAEQPGLAFETEE